MGDLDHRSFRSRYSMLPSAPSPMSCDETTPPSTAEIFTRQDFCREKLPDDEIYVPPHHQPINPEDEDDGRSFCILFCRPVDYAPRDAMHHISSAEMCSLRHMFLCSRHSTIETSPATTKPKSFEAVLETAPRRDKGLVLTHMQSSLTSTPPLG